LHLSYYVSFLKSSILNLFIFSFPQPALYKSSEYGIRLQVVVEERCAKAVSGQQWHQKE